MRPVRRGTKPIDNFKEYKEAKPYLIQRIGKFCSYCEKYTNEIELHVEHILPKETYPIWEKTWVNFLLSCNSCNSAKGTKRILFSKIYLPDVDNTFYAFEYLQDGTIVPSPSLLGTQAQLALDTLDFFGLDSKSSRYKRLVRARMETWSIAQTQLELYKKHTDDSSIKQALINQYRTTGFFSIWMKVFQNYPDIKNALIDASPSTRDSGCFDSDGNPISPSPNLDGLLNGGKI